MTTDTLPTAAEVLAEQKRLFDKGLEQKAAARAAAQAEVEKARPAIMAAMHGLITQALEERKQCFHLNMARIAKTIECDEDTALEAIVDMVTRETKSRGYTLYRTGGDMQVSWKY